MQTRAIRAALRQSEAVLEERARTQAGSAGMEVLVSEQAWVDNKRKNRMAAIDSLPPELRALVHDYSYCVVKSFMDIGVTKPAHIRHLVERVLDEFSPTRASFSNQGVSTDLNRVQR
jgi:hypothetical protein